MQIKQRCCGVQVVLECQVLKLLQRGTELLRRCLTTLPENQGMFEAKLFGLLDFLAHSRMLKHLEGYYCVESTSRELYQALEYQQRELSRPSSKVLIGICYIQRRSI
jgi:hypothetical protein